MNNLHAAGSRHDNIIECHIPYIAVCSGSIQHHPLFNRIIALYELFYSLFYILYLYLGQIAKGAHIDSKHRKLPPEQTSGCLDKGSVSAYRQHTINILWNLDL